MDLPIGPSHLPQPSTKGGSLNPLDIKFEVSFVCEGTKKIEELLKSPSFQFLSSKARQGLKGNQKACVEQAAQGALDYCRISQKKGTETAKEILTWLLKNAGDKLTDATRTEILKYVKQPQITTTVPAGAEGVTKVQDKVLAQKNTPVTAKILHTLKTKLSLPKKFLKIFSQTHPTPQPSSTEASQASIPTLSPNRSFINLIGKLEERQRFDIEGDSFVIKLFRPPTKKDIEVLQKIIKKMEQIEKKGTLEEKVELLQSLNSFYGTWWATDCFKANPDLRQKFAATPFLINRSLNKELEDAIAEAKTGKFQKLDKILPLARKVAEQKTEAFSVLLVPAKTNSLIKIAQLLIEMR